jgi:anti-sigma B factor antagonist
VPLTISVRENQGVVILELQGRIVLGPETQALRDQVGQLLSAGKNRIVLNFANVSYVDSAGVGTLVNAYTSAVRQGGSVKLLNLHDRPRETLQLTRLLTVFDVCENVADAVARFNQEKLN